MRLPDFLIVGAMKSGTSTLSDHLASHPGIHIPERELHFFNRDENFARGPAWYASRFEAGARAKAGPPVLLGEKTPTYSYQPNCAERIARVLPEVKLIWIFREPIQRAYSNHLHARREGVEPLDFRAAVQREPERIGEDIFKGYVERSRYVLQVERFLGYFDLGRMHFLLLEHLVEDPKAELDRLTDFLEIDRLPGAPPAIHSNPTTLPFSPLSIWLAGRLTGRSGPVFKAVRYLNSRFPRTPPPIPDDLVARLRVELAPYNDRLSALTGLDLSAWDLAVSKGRVDDSR